MVGTSAGIAVEADAGGLLDVKVVAGVLNEEVGGAADVGSPDKPGSVGEPDVLPEHPASSTTATITKGTNAAPGRMPHSVEPRTATPEDRSPGLWTEVSVARTDIRFTAALAARWHC